jgi:hypothetical protein
VPQGGEGAEKELMTYQPGAERQILDVYLVPAPDGRR